MTAATIGRFEEAEQHYLAAMQEIDTLPARMDAPRIRHWYAKMLIDRGRPEDGDRARRLLTTAMDEYRIIGMPWHLAKAEELSSSL